MKRVDFTVSVRRRLKSYWLCTLRTIKNMPESRRVLRRVRNSGSDPIEFAAVESILRKFFDQAGEQRSRLRAIVVAQRRDR